jgi:hypothetical protein
MIKNFYDSFVKNSKSSANLLAGLFSRIATEQTTKILARMKAFY